MNNSYMVSKIVSVRMNRGLLAQLERVARAEQRSVSAQIVKGVKACLVPCRRRNRLKATMGRLEGPSLSELQRLRAVLSFGLRRRNA
jgi:hypothetical protein